MRKWTTRESGRRQRKRSLLVEYVVRDKIKCFADMGDLPVASAMSSIIYRSCIACPHDSPVFLMSHSTW